jgi:hypothetical protein
VLHHWPVVTLLLLGELAMLLFVFGVTAVCWAVPRLTRTLRWRRSPERRSSRRFVRPADRRRGAVTPTRRG